MGGGTKLEDAPEAEEVDAGWDELAGASEEDRPTPTATPPERSADAKQRAEPERRPTRPPMATLLDPDPLRHDVEQPEPDADERGARESMPTLLDPDPLRHDVSE